MTTTKIKTETSDLSVIISETNGSYFEIYLHRTTSSHQQLH